MRLGPFNCGSDSSMFWKLASLAIWISYPLGCGLATSPHVSVTGSDSVPALVGDITEGGAGRGLL